MHKKWQAYMQERLVVRCLPEAGTLSLPAPASRARNGPSERWGIGLVTPPAIPTVVSLNSRLNIHLKRMYVCISTNDNNHKIVVVIVLVMYLLVMYLVHVYGRTESS